MISALSWLKPDRFTLLLIATVVVATFLPPAGNGAAALEQATQYVVAALFFLHGARLPREQVVRGLANWRMHLVVVATSFLLFPLLGLALADATRSVLPGSIVTGIVFLACLPSTMQASVAFTAIARGNVAAAVCGASISNMLGVFVTPLAVGLLLGAEAGISLHSIESIMLRLLLPFVAGQALHPWLGKWAADHPRLLGVVDRGSILLVVYAAFGDAVVGGIWHSVTPATLAIMALVDLTMLAVALAATDRGARMLGFDRADRIAIVLCGSKKSLLAGIPLANILFPGAAAGAVLLPLMLFHQMQLMACAALARRWREAAGEGAAALQPAE
jgi:sodium/bile acid cotransporter 7